MPVGAGEQEVEIVRLRKIDAAKYPGDLYRLLDRLLGVEADDVVFHLRIAGEQTTGA